MPIPPIGAFVPYATQTDVTNINNEITTINNTLTAPGTGLVDKTNSLQTTSDLQEQHLGDLDVQFDGVDAQINTPGTGILARLNAVQAGGRVWDIAANYAQGDSVLYYELLIKANAAIAATTAFAWGTTGATWTPIIPTAYSWKGVFSATQAYAVGDVVAATSNATVLFVCLTTLSASVNNDPLTGANRSLWRATQNMTGRNMVGASSSLPGQVGLVPHATAGQQSMVLNGAGSWVPAQERFGINIPPAAATKVFAGWTIVSGSGNNAITTSKLPYIFDSAAAAKIAAIPMLQYLWSFFKHSENDSSFDQFINMPGNFNAFSYVSGGAPMTGFNSDMDNPVADYNRSGLPNPGAAVVAQTEYFELIVGRNRAGDQIYTVWFTFVNAYQSDNDSTARAYNIRESYKWAHQQTDGEEYSTKTQLVVYTNGSYVLQATERDVRSVQSGIGINTRAGATWTPPALAMPIWMEPIMLEMGR